MNPLIIGKRVIGTLGCGKIAVITLTRLAKKRVSGKPSSNKNVDGLVVLVRMMTAGNSSVAGAGL